ncbi:hypothetical protein BWQ96_09991 [Gracilariopsis chorda]|uniref:Uncharacterized protein n=1 Tax=Gracilariopsis chorda TaxID=448386 RepID=A0A2V3IDY5_9FLOR|nr:hypothetical protein BWQ96_09991 [Gracilariopsis chorda]|eukprot:PXF40299.1 hypothetical protein BWQ96_09991 [Gracilariopsis chorda]
MEADVKCFLLAEDSRAAADQALKLAKRAAVYSRPERVVTSLRLRAEAFLSAEEAGGALSDALAADRWRRLCVLMRRMFDARSLLLRRFSDWNHLRNR